MGRYWILGGCACLAAMVSGAMALYRSVERLSRPELAVAILSPVPEPGGTITAKPSRVVSVKLGVTNAGFTTLAGLRVKGECSCYFKTALPQVLGPGERCELELQLPSPPAGRDVAHIHFFAAGIAEPIQTCAVTLLVPAVADTWLHRIDRTSGTAIVGQEYSTEIVLEAIEQAGAAPWAKSIAIEPKEFCTATMRTEERRWTEDDEFLIRSYRVRLRTIPQALGEQKGAIVLRNENDSPPLAKVQVQIDVIAPLAALPEKVELRTGEPESAARVDVVSRLPGDQVVVPLFDEALIDVSAVRDATDRRLMFEIRPKSRAAVECTTAVKFAVDGGEPAIVEVRMVP
jgi:hypothetical protein